MSGEPEDDTDADRDEGTATGPPDAPAGDGDTDPSDEREEPTAEGSDPDSPGTEPGRAVPDDSDGSGTDADPDSDGRPEVDADPSSPAGDAQSRDGNGDTESFLTEAGAGDGSDAPDPGPAPDAATQEDVEHAVEDVDVDVAESPDGTAPAADALGGIDTDEIDAEELPFGDDGDAPDPEEAFEEVDVGTVDEEEQVWSRIEDDDSTEPSPTPGSDGDADGRRETVVPKNTYCERCEHFSPPPRMECTHEGSAIVDLVDRKHVRVADCPIVEERDALGERRTEADEEEESGVFVE